ncbi:MAG: hypothetical protein ACJ8AW_13735 [Rhodopila sp.]
MSDDVEDPEEAADRLAAALERIAELSASRLAAPLPGVALATLEVDQPETDLSIPEIAERLDSLIARLRAALGGESNA